MSQARHDLRLDIGLDVGPFLPGLSWLDVGDYAAFGEGVIIVDD